MTYIEIIHWVVNPVIWVALVYLFFGKPRYLSFPLVFMVTYVLFIYLRALEIYQDPVNGIHEPLFLLTVWLVPYLFIFTAGFGLAFAGHSTRHIALAFDTPVVSEQERVFALCTPIISAFFLLLPVIYILDRGVSGVAFFFMLMNPGNSFETMTIRTGGLVSNIHPILSALYSYSRALFYPVYIAMLVALCLRGRVSRVHVAVVLAAGMLFAVFTSAKSPMAVIMAAAAISWYFSKRGRISRTGAIIAGSAILGIPAVIYPLLLGLQGAGALQYALESLWRRISWVPANTSAVYFDAYTHYFPHLGFSSNRITAALTQTNFVAAPAQVYDDYYQAAVPGGLVNSSFFASFYADWGMAGVILGSILVGVCVVWVQVVFDRYYTDALGIGVRAVVLIGMMHLMISNFYSVALGRGFISLPLALVLLTPFIAQHYVPRAAPPRSAPMTEVAT